MGPGPLALDVLQTIDASAQAKEARTTPGRAGNGARDGNKLGLTLVSEKTGEERVYRIVAKAAPSKRKGKAAAKAA